MRVIRPHPCRIKLLVNLLVFRWMLMLRRCADGPEQKSGGHQDNDAAPSDHKHHSGHVPDTTRDSATVYHRHSWRKNTAYRTDPDSPGMTTKISKRKPSGYGRFATA